MAGSRIGILLFVSLVTTAGCARSLVERAIAARGGPLVSLSRTAEADVHAGFPGRWRWRFDYRVPDRLRWTLATYGEEQSVSFDGTAVRYYLGSAGIAAAPPALGDFRSLVRWTAVTTLDALDGATEISVRELAATELPSGTAAGLVATYRDDGARYTLLFDEGTRLVAAEGPIVVPTIAAGQMRASFSQFQNAAGYELAYRSSYTLDGKPFFDESILRYVPNDRLLTQQSFAGPPRAVSR